MAQKFGATELPVLDSHEIARQSPQRSRNPRSFSTGFHASLVGVLWLLRCLDRVDMHALLARVSCRLDRHVIAIEALHRFRVVDRPDSLLVLVHKDRLLAAFYALLHAHCT